MNLLRIFRCDHRIIPQDEGNNTIYAKVIEGHSLSYNNTKKSGNTTCFEELINFYNNPSTDKKNFPKNCKTFFICTESIIFIGLGAWIYGCNLRHYILLLGVFMAWNIFMFIPKTRLLIAATGIMGFNIWLITYSINTITSIQSHNIKETAFIIAISILAWLAMSCYVLSLLKDNQSENE
jgi:hypothetical protein